MPGEVKIIGFINEPADAMRSTSGSVYQEYAEYAYKNLTVDGQWLQFEVPDSHTAEGLRTHIHKYGRETLHSHAHGWKFRVSRRLIESENPDGGWYVRVGKKRSSLNDKEVRSYKRPRKNNSL